MSLNIAFILEQGSVRQWLKPRWSNENCYTVKITQCVLFFNLPTVLETFINDYLLRINEDIKKRNMQIDTHPVVDIFTRPKSIPWFTTTANDLRLPQCVWFLRGLEFAKFGIKLASISQALFWDLLAQWFGLLSWGLFDLAFKKRRSRRTFYIWDPIGITVKFAVCCMTRCFVPLKVVR